MTVATKTFPVLFEMGNKVYIDILDSEQFLISDIVYSTADDRVTYELLDCTGARRYVRGEDLTTDKNVI